MSPSLKDVLPVHEPANVESLTPTNQPATMELSGAYSNDFTTLNNDNIL